MKSKDHPNPKENYKNLLYLFNSLDRKETDDSSRAYPFSQFPIKIQSVKHPETKFMKLKKYITDKLHTFFNSDDPKDTAYKKTIIKNYLDIRIDDHNGILSKESFCINLDTFTDFVGMNSGNKEILRNHFINDTHKHFTRDVNYIVHKYSRMQLQKRLEGHTQDKRYNMIHINIDTFIQLLFESQTRASSIVCEYFIFMENLQFKYMQQDVEERHQKRIADMKQKITDSVASAFSQSEGQMKFFKECIDVLFSRDKDQCFINLRFVYTITKRQSKFSAFKDQFLQFVTKNLERCTVPLNYEQQGDDTFINLDCLKYWLLCFDGENINVYLFREYFIKMERLALKNLQKEFDAEQEKFQIVKGPCAFCYFYILRLDDDIFKYGITSSLRLRQAAYNVGRWKQVKFFCVVEIASPQKTSGACRLFEQMFSKEFEKYKIRGSQELICIDKNVLVQKLETMLIAQG